MTKEDFNNLYETIKKITFGDPVKFRRELDIDNSFDILSDCFFQPDIDEIIKKCKEVGACYYISCEFENFSKPVICFRIYTKLEN